MMNEKERMEALLREDGVIMRHGAEAAAMPEETLRALRPAIARACVRIERQRRLRRQCLIMLAAMTPAVVMLALAGHAALTGRDAMLRAMAWPAGAFSACALLTLPIMEHFLREGTAPRLCQDGGMNHAE